jgi:hypothetical protein
VSFASKTQKSIADKRKVLGLNSQVSAQRLARLLLADPLGNVEGWEQELEKAGDGNERAVLLK